MPAPKKKRTAKKATKATKTPAQRGNRPNAPAKKPANRSAPTFLKGKVLAHELLGLADVTGMCRMLLTPTHRLDRPAHDSDECDRLAAQAKAIDHVFVVAD